MLEGLSDHLTSVRMRVLEWLVVLVALAALYGAIQQIKDTTAEDPFLFLRLFTTSRDPLPSFVSFLSFLVPLMAIGLGFNSVNGEHSRRTLSRILSQPIYRDALLFGKLADRLMTLSISLVTLWLLVIGLGLLMIGIPPGGRGDCPELRVSPGDDRLCRRLAGAGFVVLDPVPLGGDRGAGHARPVASRHLHLAGAGRRLRANDHSAGPALHGARPANAGDGRTRADFGAAFAVDAFTPRSSWRCSIRPSAHSGRSI